MEIGSRAGRHGGTQGLRGQATEIIQLNLETKILVYKRIAHGENKEPVLVILNFGDHEIMNYGIGIQKGMQWNLRFNSAWKGYDEDFSGMEIDEMRTEAKSNDEKAWIGEINIPANGAQIYTL